MAYGFMNRTPTEGKCTPHSNASEEENYNTVKYSDFFYGFGPRFSPIKKSELKNITSMFDFLTSEEEKSISKLESVYVVRINHERQSGVREYSNTHELTPKQLEIIHSANYSEHFNLRGEYKGIDEETGQMVNSFFGPHYTVVPEKQAKYLPGETVLINYFTSGNKENTRNLDETKLRPAKLYFTVTMAGEISDIRLHNHSGYQKIDDAMSKLLQQLPGEWEPAENVDGEKVDQELVISFGMVGC